MESRVYVGALLAASFVALSAGIYGCTAIVSFDDKSGDGGGHVTPTGDAGGDDDAGQDATTPGEDAGEDSSVVDSSMDDDATADASPTMHTLTKPAYAPSGSGTLTVPSSCNPCSYYTGTVNTVWTCGNEHPNLANCPASFDSYATYQCAPGGVVEFGYECPASMACNPGGELNAFCDPCSNQPDETEAFSGVNNSDGGLDCLECSKGAAVSEAACTSTNPCTAGATCTIP